MSALDEPLVWSGRDDSAIRAKFAPPPLPRHLVHRDRLDQKISLAVQHRLTVVTGPPGAGKTVLLADWAQGRPSRLVGWLSIEEDDNDPERLRGSIAAALGIDPSSQGARLGNWLGVDGDRYVNLGAEPPPCYGPRVLVMDDFHLLTDEMTVRSVADLVDHLPPSLRLVLVGQKAPAFPLRRLLATGEASSLSDGDLRFTAEESAALVALTARKFIPPDQLGLLTERSEGWAAGLYLAALALADQDEPSEFIRRFSGAFGPVAEYLELEMLLRQPPDLIKFLLQTSVLDHLNAEVCQAVSGRRDAGEILGSLSEHNLFVIPISSEDAQFRYHRLFADLLRSRLQRENASVSREAHFNAATRFEKIGDARYAAYHFVRAQCYGRAISLLFSNIVQGWDICFLDEGTALLAASPEQDGGEDPIHVYIQAAALMSRLQLVQAAQLLERLRAITVDHPDQQQWQGRAEFLWALYAEGIADVSSVLDHTRAAIELMGLSPDLISGRPKTNSPEEAWLQTIDTAIYAHLPVLAARACVLLGQLDEAEDILEGHFANEDIAEASEPSTVATLAARRGRLSDAYRLGKAALQRAEVQGGCSLATLDARLVLAEVLFEHNELDMAQEQLEAALQLPRSAGAAHWALAAEVDLVRVMIAQERPRDALNRLGRLRQLGLRTPPPHHLLQKLNDAEIGCRLSLGDLEGVLIVARSAHAGDISNEVLARIDLASGRPDQALARLNSRRAATVATEIRRLVLLACTERQHGHALQADEAIRKAVDTARPEGYVRPFLEGVPQVLPSLRAIFATCRDPYLTLVIGQAERVAPRTGPMGPETILEPLTAREREVLGYLSSHLSGRQIAAKIYVSPNTAKSHQKAIYRKLGASSRAEAVTIAVSCGLL
jgi:LuxR family transcriptional regulator, maltose regulon positive regulatory protein